MKVCLSIGMLLAVAACNCGVPPISTFTFSCNTGSDCTAGYACLNGQCIATNSSTDGGLDCTACGDPACVHQQCAAGSVCCRSGDSALACTPIDTDSQNCGGCGITCAPNQLCTTSQCECPGGQAQCPQSQGGGVSQSQICNSHGVCECQNNSQCANRETCNTDSNSCQY